jgi:hypothetical protein
LESWTSAISLSQPLTRRASGSHVGSLPLQNGEGIMLEDMRKRGMSSPDRADTVAQARAVVLQRRSMSRVTPVKASPGI